MYVCPCFLSVQLSVDCSLLSLLTGSWRGVTLLTRSDQAGDGGRTVCTDQAVTVRRDNGGRTQKVVQAFEVRM